VKELKFSSYGPPIQTLTSAFPKALTYNGTVSKKKRDAAKALFNDDNSGHDLIIVQSAAGEAGISLHDTTGKHQRVLLNLGMPIRPSPRSSRKAASTASAKPPTPCSAT
jgi:hypothetical protein